ncbi:unnamed protein product [Rotaria sp. Silwood1]|nr:unnamed protein product [Rotaria sp. Silwood1]
MNLLNIAKHLVYLTQTEYEYGHSNITTDEICASKQLFEILKSFKNSYFNEIHTYDTLELADEYDELTDNEETDDDEETNDKYVEATHQEEDSDSEADDYDENEHGDLKNNFTLEEMENVIKWVDEHPNARFTTISHRFRKIKSMKTIEKEAVHDDDLELYAIQKARELNWDTFKASKSFINTFKKENGISSRRDHCSFQKEYVSPRTLSFTVQPVTSAAGRLLNKFLLILQETEDEFGRIVKKNMIIPPNVIVQASKSGKSTVAKHYIFLNDVLRPFVHKKFLLFLDSWRTQTDPNKFRKVFPHQDSQLLIFPEGSTGHIQPQDLSFFRSWRYFHKKIEHYTHINRTQINLNDRQYFINVHSVIHNQLSAPQFENLIKSGFIQARITNETIGNIEKPKDICFKFNDLYCSFQDCDERTLLKCAWCKITLCYYHLIEDLHLHL